VMSVVAVPHEPFGRWPAQPAHPADQAQARIFEALLRQELDEVESPHFNAGVNEVRRLLTALQRRFNV